jgi:hypothetical protein
MSPLPIDVEEVDRLRLQQTQGSVSSPKMLDCVVLRTLTARLFSYPGQYNLFGVNVLLHKRISLLCCRLAKSDRRVSNTKSLISYKLLGICLRTHVKALRDPYGYAAAEDSQQKHRGV